MAIKLLSENKAQVFVKRRLAFIAQIGKGIKREASQDNI